MLKISQKNKKYYWLKLKQDFFNQREIKKLRKLPGGDTLTIIYLKLMLKSLQDNGLILFAETEEDIFEQISLEIDEDADSIKLLIIFLSKNKLLINKNDDIELLEVKELTDSETEVASRVRKHRMKKNKETMLPSNTCVTKGNTEKEKEKEKELDIEREREKEILTLYNSILDFEEVKELSKDLKDSLSSHSIQDIEKAFKKVKESDFLSGRDGKKFKCSLDWIVDLDNFNKILNGKYDTYKKGSSNKFNNTNQSSLDFDKIEAIAQQRLNNDCMEG